jgi:4-diphosphocytidyl-2-C-methyl-D-erythritol kinase
MGQAAANEELKDVFKNDPLACHCALATGRGTDLKPLPALKSDIVLSKPPISVSTAEVYEGIDHEEIPERPNNQELIEGLSANNLPSIEKNMINVLENFTLKSYPIIVYTKNKMQSLTSGGVLMSGSGPTVYCLCTDTNDSKRICREMSKINKESFWTRTTW